MIDLQFLSIQAQDFIEDGRKDGLYAIHTEFLSIQAQDFIEDARQRRHQPEIPDS